MRAHGPDEQGTNDAGGVGIAWERHGDAGPWVLVVPTWHLLDSRASKFQVPHLARRFRVLTYDPRGSGASDRPASGYAIEDHGRDALAVLDRHGVDRAIVVGASRGANHAAWLAVEHPERVERLLLVGEAIGIPLPDAWFPAARADFERFTSGFFGACFTEPHSLKAFEDAKAWARGTTADVLEAGHREFDPGLVLPRLGEVRCPTLVLHGEEDAIVPAKHARKVADAIPGAELLLIEGGGHRPDLRDPALVHTLLDDFLGPGAARPARRAVPRAARRPARRVLVASSPIGLGHVHRGLAIARALRERVPDVEVDWLAQEPAAAVLRDAGERVHPASAQLAAEVPHIESYAQDHRLPIYRAWRDMDEILFANFMVFRDVVRETRYDLWVGDEAWEVDHHLHEAPELKTAPYAFLTDFVGWLPMDEAEAPRTADHNADMIGQVERRPWVRDAALFLGEPEDVVERDFGPGLPAIREWVAGRFAFPGYVLPAGHRPPAERPAGPPQVVAAVGGTSAGAGLLARVLDAFALLRRDVPDARLLVVGGPRIDLGDEVPDGVAFAGLVPDLPAVLASCDLAVVQGGLATTMELVAARRPFVWVPLRDHCEQQLHVAHRLRRLGAPPPTAFEHTTPEALAALMLERLGATTHYAPVDRGGAGRVADVLARLLGVPQHHDHHQPVEGEQHHAVDPA